MTPRREGYGASRKDRFGLVVASRGIVKGFGLVDRWFGGAETGVGVGGVCIGVETLALTSGRTEGRAKRCSRARIEDGLARAPLPFGYPVSGVTAGDAVGLAVFAGDGAGQRDGPV